MGAGLTPLWAVDGHKTHNDSSLSKPYLRITKKSNMKQGISVSDIKKKFRYLFPAKLVTFSVNP